MIGGSGIISSEICQLAVQKGNSVTIFNRGRRREEINPSAKLIIGDVRNDDVVNIKNKLEKEYDVVIDFISYKPQQLKKTLDITANRCRQFIFVSSATVYSPDAEPPYNEESKIGNPLWAYAQDKADCEKWIKETKLPCNYTIIRPYVTYSHTRIPYQIAPIEYYTIINRLKCHKPVVICGKETKCTLTTAKDFAVGAYGLFLDSNSYGETFNVIGDYQTTWGNVIKILAEKLHIEPELIDIPYEYIKTNRNHCGFDADEVLGDKSRDMVFDNRKIKSLVPSFTHFCNFDDAIDDSIRYFNEQSHQAVNYKWDAGIDRFIEKYAHKNRIILNYDKLSLGAYGNEITEEQKKVYMNNRTDLRKVVSKVKRKLIGK